jgi:hypothetical protein
MDVLIGYSPCIIRFVPNDEQTDRTLIEFHQDVDGSYFLRAIDVEKYKEVCKLLIILMVDSILFCRKFLIIKLIDLVYIYKFRFSVNQFDEIRSKHGV